MLKIIRFYSRATAFIPVVTDRKVGECVDPEGNGVTMGRGWIRGLAHPAGSKISS